MALGYDEVKEQVMLGWDPGDAWGSAMGAFFALAGELWMRDDGMIPDAWRYKPGLGGDPREPDGEYYELFREAETFALEHLGAILHRYTDILTCQGKSY